MYAPEPEPVCGEEAYGNLALCNLTYRAKDGSGETALACAPDEICLKKVRPEVRRFLED